MQTAKMLIRLGGCFTERTVILLVLLWGGSVVYGYSEHNYVILPFTHLCLVQSSILANWTSPFSILGMSGHFFYYFLLHLLLLLRPTVKALIRQHVLRQLIWVYNVCQGPIYGKERFGLVWFLFYGPSTYFRSFRARSVTLTTLFLGKPPRQFTST